MRTFKVVLITIVSTLLAILVTVIIIFLVFINNRSNNTSSIESSSIIYSSESSSSSISSSEIDNKEYIEINNKLINILESYSSFLDSKKISEIISINYLDNKLYVSSLLDSQEIRLFDIDILKDISIDELFIHLDDESNYEINEFKTYKLSKDNINIDLLHTRYQRTFKGYLYDIDEDIKGVIGIFNKDNEYNVIYDIRYDDNGFINNIDSKNNMVNEESLYYSLIQYLFNKK